MKPIKPIIHYLASFAAMVATSHAVTYTWQGGSGAWTDQNWNNPAVVTNPASIGNSNFSRNYNGDDFIISSGTVSSTQRITLVDGSIEVTGATLTIIPGGSNLSALSLGHGGGTAATATFTNSTVNFSPHNNAGKAVQVRNGSSLTLDNTAMTISGGNNPGLELTNSSDTALITNGSSLTAAWIRTDNNSQITFESGTITLSAANPLRSANAFNNDINWTGAVGAGTIIHTDLSDNNNNLAGKITQGYFMIDGVNINPTISNSSDWTVQANIDTLNAELAALPQGGRRLFLDNTVAGQQSLYLVDTDFEPPVGNLVTSIVTPFPSPTIAENPTSAPNPSSAAVASGDTKGQSFSLAADTTITSFVFEIDGVTTEGTFSLSIYPAMDNLPWLSPVLTDSGTLPTGITSGDLLQIDLDSGLDLERGSYIVTLEGISGEFALEVSADPLFGEGALIERNAGSGNKFALTSNADADAVFAVLGTQSAPSTPGTGPNIIFILADDLGWTDIKTGGNGPNVLGGTDYGSGFYQTPNLARMVSDGLSFTHCYVQPNCAPTRAALFSGQYAPRSGNGVYHVQNLNRGNGNPDFTGPSQREDIPASHTTVAEALQSAGYVTAHFGKFHVGNHEGGISTMPENQGFDFNFGGANNGNPGGFFASGGTFSSSVGPGLDAWASPYTQSYIDNILKGPVSNPLNTRALDYPVLYPNAATNDPGGKAGDNKHLTDAMGDAGVAFMNDHLQGELSSHPFFMQFHFYAVHTPIQPRSDLATKYGSVPDGAIHGNDNYAGLVEGMDQSIGRILDYLDDPNGDGNTSDSIADNTVVLFCSDNGGHIGPTDNDPLRHRKGSFFDGGMRVPLIVSQPGTIPAGQQTDTLVHAVDFYPTLVGLAGGSMPGGINFDGTSFSDHLDDPVANPRDRETIYYHFPGYLDQRARPVEVSIKRIDGKDYKLIYNYDLNYTGNPSSGEDTSEGLEVLTEPWQLFNLTDDVSETTDLLDGSYSNWLLYGDIAIEMADEINAWLNQPGADWDAKKLVEDATNLEVPYPTSASLPSVTVPFSETFRIDSSTVDDTTNEITLGWPSEAGFNYRIEVSDNLGSWATIVETVASQGTHTSHTFPDPDIATETERFYRVVLLP